ncbi:N-acetylmuramoyl-L-alanine amidase [Aquimarina sp. MMG016]|uniref:N-acetylmuramoyl-L-alanine amidase n=1 Tax=Aquimarina sp. MMG016 TaxID=2822690 RepID=UPI001B3A1110|nr:N-acetylmuramoyl-L-alanine amidase [Aquimarina sp. MMG016]MBQ4822017.1 N-acetylmuramoyl-L-alanine amidase [Aquimarina sp. MMG016]
MKINVLPTVICCFFLVLYSYAQEQRHVFKGESSSSQTINFSNTDVISQNKAFIRHEKGLAIKGKTQKSPELILKPIKIKLKRPKPFISAYTVWKGSNLDYSRMKLNYRTSRNGKSWSAWKTAVFDGHLEQTSERITSKMEFLDKRVKYIQYKVSLEPSLIDVAIADVELFHYSPGETSKKLQKQMQESAKTTAKMACGKPSVISRGQWGAIPRNSAATSAVSHLIVHHEFGSNTSSDWAARVRSIQNFHINGNGWSDIGYNFLVDPNGVIYEGRAGGDNAIGAHFCGRNRNTMGVCMLGDYSSVTPTTATQNSLKNLLAWKADKENINPIGSSFHYSVNRSLTHIAGHRDAGCSACPGNGGYATLGGIRTGVNSLVANGCSGGGNPPPSDNTPPTTSISGGSVQTGDFTVNFTDNDNVGVTRRYYQVLEKYSSSFLANRRKGFFNENFGQDFGVYDKGAGTWNVTDGRLKQTNTTSDNTLWSSYLIQDSGLPYLYEFAAKLNSTSGPRKFGIHIMSSDGTLSQRGNSYLIWFSGEDNKVRIYETVNNLLYFRAIADVSLDNNWAKYRVTYSPAYGVLQVWKNNEYLLNWTDSSPVASGVAISLRTNKTSIEFDDLKVYKYRGGNSALITAGSGDNNKDLRTTTGKIKSMVRDDAGNWSSPGNLDVSMNFSRFLTKIEELDKLTLYPNEVTDQATIKWQQPEYGAVHIGAYDMQGREIARMPKDYMDKGLSELDITSLTDPLPTGLYLIRLSSGSYNETIRMMKK